MARSPREMADILISLYRESDGKDKGRYLVTKDQFKVLAGKYRLTHPYLWDVDSCLREDGYFVVDLREEEDQIAVLSIPTVMKDFQELPRDLVEKHASRLDAEDEW